MTKVGLFGIGLDTYCLQFDGLLDNLKTYQQQIKNRIAEYGVEVADAGMVDNPMRAPVKQPIILNHRMWKSFFRVFPPRHYRQPSFCCTVADCALTILHCAIIRANKSNLIFKCFIII
jgi:hypothetical protein